jgi:hypothetical protein
MRDVTEFEVFAFMRRHGGHFAAALADAYDRADAENRAKINATWAELIAEHRENVRLQRRATLD